MNNAARIAAGLALAAAVTVSQAGVSINVNLGAPEYYGQVPPMGPNFSPRVWNANPILAIGALAAGLAPIYLNVPDKHRKHWSKYCGRYDACNRPVYFVRDNWYRKTYAPEYRRAHPERFGEHSRPMMDPGRGHGEAAPRMERRGGPDRPQMRGPQGGPRGPQGAPQGGPRGQEGGHGGPHGAR